MEVKYYYNRLKILKDEGLKYVPLFCAGVAGYLAYYGLEQLVEKNHASAAVSLTFSIFNTFTAIILYKQRITPSIKNK